METQTAKAGSMTGGGGGREEGAKPIPERKTDVQRQVP